VAGDVVKPKFRRRHLVGVVAANLVRCLFRDAARTWGRNFGATAPALGSMTLLLLMAGLVGITAFALRNLEQEQAAQASLLHRTSSASGISLLPTPASRKSPT